MNLYQKWMVPRLVDVVMRNRAATRYRSLIVPKACGTVFEIGIGSGLNLPFYGTGVERIYGLDPSEELLAMARKKARAIAIPVDFIARACEEIPLDDSSVDTVVMTWTLCSIADPAKALKELRRVIKSGGTLLFVEHGLAPEIRVQTWQQRLNPLWCKLTGGSNLNRKIDQLIRTAGFDPAELKTEYAEGPRPFSYTYSGQARPDACITRAPQ
ncbi:MAG: class I SAM-dependent methyltransferase [Burkholderiales bacterium]|nr:class I SAM-dependent methyltransferase [Burkholderiales bacterium]